MFCRISAVISFSKNVYSDKAKSFLNVLPQDPAGKADGG